MLTYTPINPADPFPPAHPRDITTDDLLYHGVDYLSDFSDFPASPEEINKVTEEIFFGI